LTGIRAELTRVRAELARIRAEWPGDGGAAGGQAEDQRQCECNAA